MALTNLDKHIFVCVNQRPPGSPKGDCMSRGGQAVRDELKQVLEAKGLNRRMRANAAGCLDRCAKGVTVVVYPEQVWYGNVTVADVAEIVESHLEQGTPVERLRLR